MKRIIALLCGAVLVGTLGACAGNGKPNESETPSGGGNLTPSVYTDMDFDTSGTIIVKTEYEIYGSDAPEVSYTIKNNTSNEFTYGVQYAIEVNRDGKWYQVPFPDNTAWIDIGIILKASGMNTDSFKFSALDYKMIDGKYRLIKEIGGKRYFAEFQIGKSPITAETPFGYQALEKLPKEYATETAAANGDIVITLNGIKNAGKLNDFISKVAAYMPAMVRIVQYTTEGDPILTDYIYNADHSGYFLIRQDNSRDKFGGSDVGITETIYSFLITDGTALYLSNCANWELTQVYTDEKMIMISSNTGFGDLTDSVALVKKMTEERLKWNTTRYKVYSPSGRQNVALYAEDLSYGYEGLTSSEMRMVKDPNGIATEIIDVIWLDENAFVLVCGTTTGLIYFNFVGTTKYPSSYGTAYTIVDGRFEITK